MEKAEKRDKPDSVFDHHSSRPKVTRGLQHSTREHRPSRPQAFTYVSLHLVEFTWFHYSMTCTYFLLHLSSPRGGRALPATMLFGVRTFLPGLPPSDDPLFSARRL